jgi:hypothetical protein
VAALERIARERTDLDDADIEHLAALTSEWSLVADLAIADLVLWLPTWHGGGFVAVAQVRPTTGATAVPTTSSARMSDAAVGSTLNGCLHKEFRPPLIWPQKRRVPRSK